jgi:hypothetical protein
MHAEANAMRLPRLAATLLVSLVVACAAPPPSRSPSTAPPPAGAPPSPAAPPAPFAGSWLPLPPGQGDPWQPPPAGELPAVLLSAVEVLFEQGLADPRGLAYREVEIAVGDVWSGGAHTVKTHAWGIGAEGRFGVTWSGLVYPLVSIGAAADVDADVRAVLHEDAAQRARFASEHPGVVFCRWRSAAPEADSVSEKVLSPLAAAMLLRLGEHALARDLWQAWTAGMHPHVGDDDVHLRDPYLLLATTWTWALFDRAVTAHMRGDDPMALASARALRAIGPTIEAEADRRGFERRDAAHMDFLDQVPALLADQERRAVEEAAGQGAGGDRVVEMIRALELVDARQWGQPGGVDLGQDRRVKALVGVGEPAIEPLLEALEHDTRLTRSVHFGRDFDMHRSILGAHEAAYVALANILQTSFFGADSTADSLSAHGAEGRREVAAAIRAFWQTWRGVPLEERWYRVLADDAAPPERWFEAAGNIVRPTNVSVSRGAMAFTTTSSSPAPDGPPTLRGEILRSKTAPSVTALLVRRADELGKRMGASHGEQPSLDVACSMAEILGAWDVKGGLAAITRQAEAARKLFGGKADRSLDAGAAALCVAHLTSLRQRGGDTRALGVYARWVVTLTPDVTFLYLGDLLAPLWQNAGDPAAERAAEVLFGDPRSPWTNLATWHIADLLQVPLVRLGAFRRLVVQKLGDRTRIGDVTVGEGGAWDYNVATGGGGMSAGGGAQDPLSAAPGTRLDLRVCDLVGTRLRLDGAPAYQVYWTAAARDEALEKLAAFVRAQGPAPRKR